MLERSSDDRARRSRGKNRADHRPARNMRGYRQSVFTDEPMSVPSERSAAPATEMLAT